MQEIIYLKVNSNETTGLKALNEKLLQGWEVINIFGAPTETETIHALVLIQNKVSEYRQQVICLNQGSGSVHDHLKDLLEDGWTIKQMETGSSADGSCCFVWLNKIKER